MTVRFLYEPVNSIGKGTQWNEGSPSVGKDRRWWLANDRRTAVELFR